jgi:hypothetical protein
MRAWFGIFLISFCWGKPTSAATPFQEAFAAKADVHRLEQERLVLPFRFDLDEISKDEEGNRLRTQLLAAQERLREILAKDENSLQFAAKSKTENPSLVDRLNREFPNARKFDLAEWHTLRELFGEAAEDAFLRSTFALQKLDGTVHSRNSGGKLLWIRSPAALQAEEETIPSAQQLEKWRAKLGKAGFTLEVVDLSPFPHLDDQAEELRHLLSERKDAPILLSKGLSSAVVYRTLDLFPSTRKLENVRGWLNIDGNLFGQPPEPRAPAASDDPTQQLKENVKAELHLLYREGLHAPTPLVDGFPIINVSTNSKAGLRSGIVPDGSSWYLPNSNFESALPIALPLFGDHQQAGPALTDDISGAGF